jgi:effector-binding domain-containing protein
MRMRVLIGVAVLLAAGVVGFSQENVATGPAADDYVLTTPRATQLKATSYVYQSVQTSIRESGGPIQKIMLDLTEKMKAGQFTPSGGPIFIYKTLPKGVDDVVEMEIGMPVADKAVPPDGYELRVLESAPSATAIFQGPMASLSLAYPKFFEGMMKSGQTPAGELRERIFYWEDEKSVNNVMMIEMGTAK